MFSLRKTDNSHESGGFTQKHLGKEMFDVGVNNVEAVSF